MPCGSIAGNEHTERFDAMMNRRTHVIVAAIGAVASVLYLAAALRYPRGSIAQPGPGIYPILVGVLLLIGSLGTGLEAALRPSPDAEIVWPTGKAGRRVLAVSLAILGYVVLLPTAGWAVSGFLVTLIALHVMNLRRWPVKVALALVVGVGSSYAFAILLDVPLPLGIWFG
jgi:hypothetical protein